MQATAYKTTGASKAKQRQCNTLSYFQPGSSLPCSNHAGDYSSSLFFKNTRELPPTTSPEEHLQGEVIQLQGEDDTSTCHPWTGVTGSQALCPNIAYMYLLLMPGSSSYSDNNTWAEMGDNAASILSPTELTNNLLIVLLNASSHRPISDHRPQFPRWVN